MAKRDTISRRGTMIRKDTVCEKANPRDLQKQIPQNVIIATTTFELATLCANQL